ncbi:MAG: thioesterase [Aeromicrobium sp.]|jgi:acyl-coenzyme A thioesterase PaaI-like protein|nr:thioesterase [Aeromicrobium sp.]
MSWSTFTSSASPEQVRAYGSALDALHAFHDALASAAPRPELLDRLAEDLRGWTDTLAPMAVPELDRLAGRSLSLPVRGHPAIPPVTVDSLDGGKFEGTVTFGAFFLGGGGSAHGGTILTIFDEVLGVLAVTQSRAATRTAYLKADFRATVPVDVPVRVVASVERAEGRKRFLRGEMWVGETLCAEADALFVVVRDPTA